jgi:hypothetical protein
MTTTIQAQVSQATLSKVSRLFNASLTDCLNELLQNARRAGASRVTVTLSDALFEIPARGRHLVIADDGVGIANPQTLLTLGESDWSNEIQQQEAPAGMGLFSLANRSVMIRSHNWQVHLTPAHFAGEAIALVEPCEMISGTRISFTIEEKESKFFDDQVCHIAKFYPLPLWLNGREIPRQDFLGDALCVESWQGLCIGIRYTYQWKGVATINFYGLVLEQALPSLCCNGQTLFLHLNVVDCPQLKLVLPARKEVVQDEFWSDLTTEVQRILYRYVATLPHHDLSYKQWQKARSMGIELPMARACLNEFTPAIADFYDLEKGQPMIITERSLLIDIDALACSEQQVFWRAFQQAQLDYEPVAPHEDYSGYPWYDRLLRLSDVRFEIEQDGIVMGFEQWREEQFLKGKAALVPGSLNVTVDQVWAIAHVTDGDLNDLEIRLACEVLLVEDPEEYWEKVEQTPIVLSQSANLAVDDLATLLEASYFSPSEDSDSDSLYTQQEDFREMAYERAAKALLTDQAALQARMAMAAERHLRWMVPSNQKMEIRLMPRGIDDPVVSVEMGTTD